MTKTPEEMAEEYRKDRLIQANQDYQDGFMHGYCAGYKAATLESMRPKTDAVGDALSAEAIQCAQRLLGPKPSHYTIFAPSNSEGADTPDLQEQVEALQQYMNVVQRKIMALQANVEFLLYHNKDKMGEAEAIRRMRQTMQGFGRNHE